MVQMWNNPFRLVGEISMAQSMTLNSAVKTGTFLKKARVGTRSAPRTSAPKTTAKPEYKPVVVAPVPMLSEQERIAAEEARVRAIEVRAAQKGDPAAVAQLIENNRTWVRGIAYSVLGDAHLAEDAAQEVCVRMVRHIGGLEAPEAFRPWVYRMTRNVALSMAQRRERTPQPVGIDTETMHEGARVSADEMPGATLDDDERVNTILDAIHRLPDIYKEVLILKHVRELSYAEMSTILDVSIKSLEVRLVRARKMLQDRLGRRFDRGRRRDPGEDKA